MTYCTYVVKPSIESTPVLALNSDYLSIHEYLLSIWLHRAIFLPFTKVSNCQSYRIGTQSELIHCFGSLFRYQMDRFFKYLNPPVGGVPTATNNLWTLDKPNQAGWLASRQVASSSTSHTHARTTNLVAGVRMHSKPTSIYLLGIHKFIFFVFLRSDRSLALRANRPQDESLG